MGNNSSFDSRVRNQLKDFIGSKRWSVSRFASRYVDLYAEIYSKMEAPGTSTARKLIEDKNHIFSEREAVVLERMTNMPFVQHWLENQHGVLLAKSSGYAETSNNLDPESLLEWEIRRQSDKGVTHNTESLISVVQRYVSATQTAKPLVILTEYPEYALTLMRQYLSESEETSVEMLLLHGEDMPLDTLFCNTEVPPDCVDGSQLLNRSIEIMQSAQTHKRRRHVILIYDANKDESELISDQWSPSAFIFVFSPPSKIAESITPDESLKEDYREYCLSRMRTLPQIFKDEIMACKQSFENCDSADECAENILKLYNEQREWLNPDSYYYKPLLKLISTVMPDEWLNSDFDRRSFLTAVAEFPVWLKRKKQELTDAGISIETDILHRKAMDGMEGFWVGMFYCGFNESHDAEGWHIVFEEDYTRSMME